MAKKGEKGGRREVLLSCQHSPLYDPPYPVSGDSVYCRYCQDYRRVLSLLEQYSVICVSHCRFHGGYGADLTRAEQVAHRHVTKYHARVYIRQGERLVADLEPQSETLLPAYTEDKERQAAKQRDHQAVLRKFLDSKK